MIDALKNMLGFGPAVDLSELVKGGAIIVDVRSKAEYAGGHIRGSVNIPLDTLGNHIKKLKDKNKPIITCCASGVRSAQAKHILTSNGFTRVYNGGGWSSLRGKMGR